MNKSIVFYAYVFKQLLIEELIIFRETFADKIIDLGIWVSCTAGIFGYIMPAFGLSADYGSFQLAGLIASAGLFEVFPSIMMLVSDIEGDRVISYQLTLPVPSWLILMKKIAYYAINGLSLAICVTPIGKLVLWNQFSLTNISIIPFLLMVIVTSIFYGTLILWLASKVKSMSKIGNIWMRFIFPMWFLGGFQFSWSVLYKVCPPLAYLNLLNPMTYVMEGMRAALLGQQEFLSVWLCILALIVFSMLSGWRATVKLKQRLDFV